MEYLSAVSSDQLSVASSNHLDDQENIQSPERSQGSASSGLQLFSLPSAAGKLKKKRARGECLHLNY